MNLDSKRKNKYSGWSFKKKASLISKFSVSHKIINLKFIIYHGSFMSETYVRVYISEYICAKNVSVKNTSVKNVFWTLYSPVNKTIFHAGDNVWLYANESDCNWWNFPSFLVSFGCICLWKMFHESHALFIHLLQFIFCLQNRRNFTER